MNRTVNVGLIGFGTVGSGVFELLQRNAGLIARRTGIEIRLAAICDTRTAETAAAAGGVKVTGDWRDVTTNSGIDIVAELIGGTEPAKSIHISALEQGKDVVTANKKLLAEDGLAIFETAARHGRRIGFEAAVGGGIPCILALRDGLAGNAITSVTGILNGTTNYILTKMEEEGLSFELALKQAQEQGFAEADPTFDIEGFDAAHKISIISMLASNRAIDFSSVHVEGITGITDLDIRYAREMGYTIKLLGISKQLDGAIDVRVHPAMIRLTHPLASVRNEFNAIMYVGDMAGPITLTGRGAGSLPTASAVVSDIVRIATMEEGHDAPLTAGDGTRYVTPDRRVSRYYMRVHTEDRPGILSKISGVLGDHDISIASVIQKEVNSPSVPLVIMTHEAGEDRLSASLAEIKKFEFIHGMTIIRVEDSF
jgi:homoserine dehydrogenase